MFNEIRQKNISTINIFALFFFIFSRTVILIPENHFGLTISKLQFNFSFESTLLFVLLVIYALLFSFVLNSIYSKSRNTMLSIAFLVLFDCVFFALLDDCLKLIVVILGLLCVLNAIAEKQILKNSIAFPLFVSFSAAFDPLFVFSFIPLAFMVYIVCNADKHSKEKSRTLLISVIGVLIGAGINLLLTKSFEPIAVFINRLSFTDVLPTYKSWKTFMAFIPMMLIGCVLYSRLLKAAKKPTSKKKDSFIPLAVDSAGICYFFAIAGFLFFESEAFFTINLIVPISLIICFYKSRDIIENVISVLVEEIKQHKLLMFFIATIIFYWCFAIMDNYNDGVKIIKYIRY